ncbi:MAG: FHIPEP family type III secretion protein [Sphingorhabdus sp.]
MNQALSFIPRFFPSRGLSFLWLPAGLVAVVALLIVPMPPMMLDLFIATNLIIGVLLLLAALYVVKPLDFSTFPTVLLITTLFRIGISVATARMILTEAEGGTIVHQFGVMVAGGQLAVGLVVFLIISIVQFIVISKGAERVAEVAARFSLDAMPGKQLSIDSDLRSGLLTKDEAKAKRRMLEQESKFNGSLDGAMKFVKGDAIVAIVIVLINLLGGLAVGMFSHGMDAATALETYAILSIGDGLVAQLPAFFSAVAAGLLVTRTTDDETDRDLAPAIAQQITGKPHVMMIAGGMALLFGLIPGFPTLIFFSIAVLFLGIGLLNHPEFSIPVRNRIGLPPKTEAVDMPIGQARLEAPVQVAIEPLQLRVGLSPQGEDYTRLQELLAQTIAQLSERSGVPLPSMHIIADPDGAAATNSWSLSAFDAPLGSGLSQAEDVPRHIALITEHLLERNLSLFLGLQEVTDMLNRLGDQYPEVVKEAVRAVPTGKIAEVLRLLADEGVPLRNLRDAIEALADIGQYEREAPPMAERTRIAMRRHLIAPLCDEGRLRVLMVGSELEAIIRETLTEVDGQMRLAINPMQMRAMIALLSEQVRDSGARVILTSQDLRRPLRLMIAADLPEVAIISFNELNPSVPLDIVGELNRAPDALPPYQGQNETQAEYAE